ncbi:MAG: tetratricopeptide repeat protein [Trichocoleus desertorum ATA4-8-CV12]|nr:tetratricopeptide repeat protein [Trichocoleus desertorum ATA4-8-CV12]
MNQRHDTCKNACKGVRLKRLGCSCLLALGLSGGLMIDLWQWEIPTVQAQTVPAAVRQAYTLLNRGLVDDAIAAFQRAIRSSPQSIEAKLGLAIAYRRAGRDADAFQAYERVVEQDPNNRLALKTLGLLGAYRAEWQERGIIALTTFLTLDPNDLEARAQRALLLGYRGRFAESLADYQVVLQNNPPPDAILGAAQIYTYTGNAQQGLALFNRYRALGRSITGNAAIAYARALRETGNPTQAIAILQTQLQASRQLDDTAIQARSELSQAYLANQQSAEALAALDPLRGRPEAVLPLARALNELGRKANAPTLTQEAAALYRQELQRQTNPTPTLVQEVADVLSGIPAERPYALQLYRQLTQQQPNSQILALKQLALESQLGVISQAEVRQRLRTVLQPLPTNPVELQQLAQALSAIDADPELFPVYQTLLQAGVSVPFLNFRIAQIFIQQNNLPAARSALAAYANTPAGTQDRATELLLAEIERREGNLDASAQRYQAILASNPSDRDIINNALQGLASVRQTQGRTDEAIAIYNQLVALNPQDLQIQLGRAALAYQAQRISLAEAEAVLNTWLQTRPPSDTPPELVTLVGVLPPDPRREPLYNALLQVDPNNSVLQLRSIQVIAARSPAQARAIAAQLVARNPNNPSAYQLQGQVAQALGDLDQASDAYQRLLQLQPNNAEALSALGGVRFQQRRFGAAEELYSQVLAFNPTDVGAQRSLAELMAAQGMPLTALQQLEQLQVQQATTGTPDSSLSRRVQQIKEDLLRQRGFQPPWERY